MENAEREGCKQDRQECIGPCLSATFTIDQDDYKDAQDDPTIDQDKEELVKKFTQWPNYLDAKLPKKRRPVV